MPNLLSVKCEKAILFSMKRDQYHPPPPPITTLEYGSSCCLLVKSKFYAENFRLFLGRDMKWGFNADRLKAESRQLYWFANRIMRWRDIQNNFEFSKEYKTYKIFSCQEWRW